LAVDYGRDLGVDTAEPRFHQGHSVYVPDLVELVDDVEDEPGEMSLGEPVAQVRGQQEGLVAIAANEVVGYSEFYIFATLAVNVLVLACQPSWIDARVGR
jgi:hypothetical protein